MRGIYLPLVVCLVSQATETNTVNYLLLNITNRGEAIRRSTLPPPSSISLNWKRYGCKQKQAALVPLMSVSIEIYVLTIVETISNSTVSTIVVSN